jgi:hypothetical protein
VLGLNTESWNGFRKIIDIPHLEVVAWPETEGKQTISTEMTPKSTDRCSSAKADKARQSQPKDLWLLFCCKIQSHICDL